MRKWPHARQIKFAGRNHVYSTVRVGNCMENEHSIDNSQVQEGIKIEC